METTNLNRSLIIGASGGIGGAVAQQLSGDAVTLSRSTDGFDIRDEKSIQRHLEALSGSFDLIFVATGALVIDGAQPEKSIRTVTSDTLMDQYLTNAVGPMLVLKHALTLLPKNRPSVFAALSARVGSIEDNKIGGWHSYRAAKAGLNQLLHGAAIELKRSHQQATLLALHPGTVDTEFTRNYRSAQKLTPGYAAQKLLSVISRATPAQTGRFFDYNGLEIPW